MCCLLAGISARAYTIFLKPGPEGKDTYVCSWEPDEEHGDDRFISVSYDVRHTYIGWEFEIPEWAYIAEATMGLCLYDGYDPSGVLGIAEITESWEETVTWSDRPSTTAPETADWFYQGYDRYTVDVTEEIISINDGSAYGLAIIETFSFGGSIFYFYSSDEGWPTDRPELTIEYEYATEITGGSFGKIKAVYR
jgi:hypothetical protein